MAWDRTPTLHHRRSDHHPTRRKSSKRRREDHDREAELKALSNFTPVRPATDQWNAGRPLRKDSKRAKTTSFGRHWDNPPSELSLPVPGSIHSSLTSDSEYGAYKVSALDALAPRPTLRYAQATKQPPPYPSPPNRSGSQRKRFVDREPISEETMRAHKRVDDLADDLDSSDLRELMERDKRRRELKRQKERERMERRLARRAEKQKAQEEDALKSGTPPPENLERGVLGRELVGLGLEPKSAVVTSSKQRSSVESVQMKDADDDVEVENDSPRDPIASFHRTDTAPVDEPVEPVNEPVVMENTQERDSPIPRKSDEQGSIPTSAKFSGLLRSVKSRSKSTLGSEREKMVSPPPDTIDEEQAFRKDSESSTKGARFSFSSFLRWSGKSRRNSGPSSFSNTSREEMQAAATAKAQAQALAKLQGEDTSNTSETYSGKYMARKVSAPKRTRSRFREDLPEFPVSPPASRVQSPEFEPSMPILSERQMRELEPVRFSHMRYDTPTSGHRSMEATHQASTPIERVYPSPSPEPHMSMSLASIDSEGSWLSGRNKNRNASMRESLMRANRQNQAESSTESPTDSNQDELGIAEDEYFEKLTPHRNSGQHTFGRRSGEGRPSSDEEDLVDDDMKWGAVGSHPHVVHNHRHDRYTMKSHEGLLDIESESEDCSDASPTSPMSMEELAEVQRARSVNLGRGHVRNFSAGSAKLLDLTPRASVDDKRRSSDRRGSAVVFA